mmetsp:Transcript_8635/g.22698  ORF Transcript_8635/g.22698 Transcript_8635/m.22698 type:complete len:438 (-) Transcript_8635:107-1420(-)
MGGSSINRYLHHALPPSGATAATAATKSALDTLTAANLNEAGGGEYARRLKAASYPTYGAGGEGIGLPPDSPARAFFSLVGHASAFEKVSAAANDETDIGGALFSLAEFDVVDGYAQINPRLGSSTDDGRAVNPRAVCEAADTAARASLLLAGIPPATIARVLGAPRDGEAQPEGVRMAPTSAVTEVLPQGRHSHSAPESNSDSANLRAKSTRSGASSQANEGTEDARLQGFVNCSLVAELLSCLVPDLSNGSSGPGDCNLARELDVGGVLTSHYVGVYTSGPDQTQSIAPTAELLQRLLASLLPQTDGTPAAALSKSDTKGGIACSTDADCLAGEADAVCVRRLCVLKPSVWLHDAFSTGIDRVTSRDAWSVIDASLPNWAEPFWDELSSMLWAHGASAVEGWAMCAAGTAAAFATLASISIARRALAAAAVAMRV